MHRIVLILALCLCALLTSCTDAEVVFSKGVITKIELANGGEYRYKVGIITIVTDYRQQSRKITVFTDREDLKVGDEVSLLQKGD